jgi:choline dehydrogenase-like flavoprotein
LGSDLVKSRRANSIDLQTFPKDDSVVVIGSGPAGAAATLALVNAGVGVTLLEAGLASSALGLTARFGGVTIARVHRPLAQRLSDIRITGDPSTLVYEDVAPGGLTNHWSCAVPRFSPEDFRDARRAGEPFSWPIDYEDLAPWYDWIEPRLFIAGTTVSRPQLPAGKVVDVRTLAPTWQPIIEVAQRAGQAVVPTPYTYGGRTTLTLSGTVFNSFVRLIKPARRSNHLSVRFGTQALRVEWSGNAKRVRSVIARNVTTGATERIPCRAVVLAAGAINTTKILLQSTDSDFPDGLGNTHGVLGRYLHDHPLGKLEVEVASPLSFRPAAYITRTPLEQSMPLYAAGCLQWSGVLPLALSVVKGHPGRSKACGFSLFGTMAPTEGNYVTLDHSRSNVDRTPGLIVHITHPQESGVALVAARDQLLNLLDQARLQPITRGWLIDTVGSAIHFAGTCRMHASPRFGMLDAWSRLHAVPNVVVADSAAFTTGPEKNPALTAMALAARASSRLADDLRSGVI